MSEPDIDFRPVRLMTKRELRAELSMLRDYVNQLCPKGFDQILANMTDEERIDHLKHQLAYIKSCQTADTFGSMLIIFGADKITQYGATVDPETAPQALRELADRIERRETVKR